MDELKLLGVALGLACLAGVNLYLTVFVTGLAIHQHWIISRPAYQSLAILGNPLILWISGTLYVLEFFADKIPWVDSAWDTVHTIIRPIGGALLAIRVLGHSSPAFDLSSRFGGRREPRHALRQGLDSSRGQHFARAVFKYRAQSRRGRGRRRRARAHPLQSALGAGVFILLLSIILYFAPRIFRAVRVKLWLIWKKLNGPAESEAAPSLPVALSSRAAAAFARENLLGETVAWAVPCISKRLRGVPANSSGTAHRDERGFGQAHVSSRQRVGRPGPDDHIGGLRRDENRSSFRRILSLPRRAAKEPSSSFFSSGAAERASSRSWSFSMRDDQRSRHRRQSRPPNEPG